MVTGIWMLTGLEIDSSTASVVVPLMIFGFGAGLGMPALTDTVMAAVPESDAGIGSAVNDVSRELGGALSIATIGSVVSGFYLTNVSTALDRVLPDEIVELAGESVGIASSMTETLPTEAAALLVSSTNTAFVDAMNGGFVVSAIILLGSVVVALTLIPKKMRATQASADSETTGTPQLASVVD